MKPPLHPQNETFSVLIPDGESYFALPTLQCLGSAKNIEVYIISNNRQASIRFSRYSKHISFIPKGSSQEERFREILKIIKKIKIDIILPIDQPTIRFLSEHGSPLLEYTSITSLPNKEAFDIAVDKWLLAEWLKKKNIPGPASILYDTGIEFESKLAAMSFPVLIKPLNGDGGIGIQFFDDSFSLINFCKDHIQPGEFIVQSFINGYDIDCSVLCLDGKILASTIQKRIINDPMYFGPTMNIDFLYDKDVYTIIQETIRQFGWSGVVHFDLRFDNNENQVKIIEMNARYWGSIVGSYYAGINFPFLAILQGLKLEFPTLTFNSIRYVDAVTAIKISVLKIFGRKNEIRFYDKSKLNTHLKDPLPLFFSSFIQLVNKISRIFQGITKPV
ncbi:MAG: ATP-grasp domain-containing protein [Prolixibacteraceae bacterium]